MKKRKRITQKDLSEDEIENKKSQFQEAIKKELEQKDIKTTAQKILYATKDIVLEARKNKISYEKIAENIKKVYNYKISTQTIRIFVKKQEEDAKSSKTEDK